MHRIDTSTAQVDKFGAGKNGFTGGNPQTGELPTALDADFFDSVQEEIAAVIESAGISLDKSKNNQLAAAIKSLFGPGRLIGIQRFTASGVYTPTTGAKKVVVRGVGGGGGGGGCPSTTSNQQSTAGGGQSGCYAEITLDSLLSSYVITIGIGGSAGLKTPSAGGGGGSTIMAGVLLIPGGSGGYAGAAVTPTISVGGVSNGTTYPTVSVGVSRILLAAASGQPALILGSGTNQAKGGTGGSSPLGIGGQGGLGGAPGLVGVGFGAGGGGCSQLASNSGDVGGAGTSGYLEIWEYA
ncbi:phage tail protein [Pantoea vagans]|uniref:glycine-rich domain-containing protein n=1 Tax=Pantoea vagans TaxID=470934 RepID=UPI00241CC2AA|nr:phage tail protein [Pantoea vagans]